MSNYLRKFAGTLVAILILVLLVGYLYVFESKEPSEDEAKETVFIEVKEEEIKEINLKYPSQTVICRKEGDEWYLIKESKKLKADDEIISDMLAAISSMKIESVVSENPTDLAGFGLDEPKVEVMVKSPVREIGMVVGGESPVGTGTYVQTDAGNRVLLVERSSISDFLNKSADDIRERQVISLDEDKIKGMKFQSGGLSFELERKNGEWVGKDILEYVEIDQDKIAGVAGTFSRLRIDNFESDEPKELKSYGLEPPGAEIELIEDGKTVGVLFGSVKDGGSYYLKLSSGDSIYSVSEFIAKQVPKELNDFRVVRVVKFSPEKVSGLEIDKGEQTISLLKENNSWVLENEKDQKIDELRVQDLLGEINALQVEEFVDDNPIDLAPYGLDKPEIQVRISEGDKKTALLFGKTENERVYAKVADEKSVFLLNDEILEFIPSTEDELVMK